MADSEKGPASIGALIEQHSDHHGASSSVTDGASIPQQMRRRRDASGRMTPASGRRDLWSVPKPRACPATTNAIAAAYDHFAALGLLSEHIVDVLTEVAE